MNFKSLCCIFDEHVVKSKFHLRLVANLNARNRLRFSSVLPAFGSFVRFPGFASHIDPQFRLDPRDFFDLVPRFFGVCSISMSAWIGPTEGLSTLAALIVLVHRSFSASRCCFRACLRDIARFVSEQTVRHFGTRIRWASSLVLAPASRPPDRIVVPGPFADASACANPRDIVVFVLSRCSAGMLLNVTQCY